MDRRKVKQREKEQPLLPEYTSHNWRIDLLITASKPPILVLINPTICLRFKFNNITVSVLSPTLFQFNWDLAHLVNMDHINLFCINHFILILNSKYLSFRFSINLLKKEPHPKQVTKIFKNNFYNMSKGSRSSKGLIQNYLDHLFCL